MVTRNKLIYVDTQIKGVTKADEEGELFIEGYASTNDVDRAGDIVHPDVWKGGLANFLKNPVILAYHDHKRPVGRMVEHKADSKGLWIRARISKAAEDVYELVKDGVLTAFSIGFRIIDAEYNSSADVFMIKEVELHEISVVPIPCNQNTLFNLSKAFDTAEDYNTYKELFTKSVATVKELDNADTGDNSSQKEHKMTLEEIQAQVKAAAQEAAKEALAAADSARAEKAEAEARAQAEQKALDERIAAAVSKITVGESGAEKLVKELEERLTNQQKSLDDLMGSLQEKTQEILAMQKGRMHFNDESKSGVSLADKEKAVLLSKFTGKSIENTAFGKKLVEKAGPHVAGNTWELEVSLNLENEVRQRLVVAPTLRQVEMQTNVMTMPINPEAGYGTWVTNAQFGTANSSGATKTHQLGEITLNAYKLATREYMNYEEEEDSLLVLMPIVRDAMVRRTAKSVDKAFLLGAGSGADPVKGLATYVTTPTEIAVASKATVASMQALRRDLGAWGLDPSEVTYFVSTEVYYDLLEDSVFQTVDKIGDRATLLTGQVGSIASSPVLVTAELEAKAATKIGAVAVANRNFIVGNQRGLRIDTQDLVETQQKVFVASLRTGMTKLTSNLGLGVSAMRWKT